MIITPTLTYASGTWTLSQRHEKMIKTAQRKMKKCETEKETEEGSDQNSDKYQDSDVSFQEDKDEAIDTTENEEE